jgi:hypothetical protein
MGTWASNLLDGDKLHDPSIKPNLCNTAACLAGTASLLYKLSQGKDIFTWVEPEEDGLRAKGYWLLMDEEDMYNLGSEILGLTDTEADAFFYSNWPHLWLEEQGISQGSKTYELEGAVKLLELKRDGRLEVTLDDGEIDWIIDGVNVTAPPEIDYDDDEDEEPDDEDLDTGDNLDHIDPYGDTP